MRGMRGQRSLDSFGTVLSGLAKRLGLESRLVELRLQRQWPEIVGDPVAAHTWPDQIRFKKLYLRVRNSVWLHQLTFLKPALLAKLHDRAGSEAIVDIVFRVGEIPRGHQPPGTAAQDPPQPALTEAALIEASAHAASLQDPDLRNRLTLVMAAAFSRPRAEEGPRRP
jgi:hypothetical protein